MSSSPTSQEPKLETAGILRPEKQRTPPPRPMQPKQTDTSNPNNEADLPENSHPRPVPVAGSANSDNRKGHSERRPQPRKANMNRPDDQVELRQRSTLAAERTGSENQRMSPARPAQPRNEDNNRLHNEAELSQRSTPAAAGTGSGNRRLPPARSGQPRDGNRRQPLDGDSLERPAPMTENSGSARRGPPPARPAQQRVIGNNRSQSDIDFIDSSLARLPSRGTNPPQSRVATLTSRIRPGSRGNDCSDPGAGGCDGKNCVWRQRFIKLRRELDERNQANGQPRVENTRPKASLTDSDPRKQARREPMRLGNQATESREREAEFESRQGDKGHKLDTLKPMTYKEGGAKLAGSSDVTVGGPALEAPRTQSGMQRARMAMAKQMQGQQAGNSDVAAGGLAPEASRTQSGMQRAKMAMAKQMQGQQAGNSDVAAGGPAPEASRTQSGMQRAKMAMAKQMQGELAPKRPAEGSGVSGNGLSPAATRRPAATPSPRAPSRSPAGHD
jgi:hypothetical protein